jgi:hypothetical protein
MPDDHITDDPGSPLPQRRRDDYPDEDYERGPRGPYGDIDVSRPRRSELSWIDRQFLDTPIALLVIFSLCCGIFAFTFGLIGVVTCQHPDAKQKALIVTIISGILMALSVGIRLVAVAARM